MFGGFQRSIYKGGATKFSVDMAETSQITQIVGEKMTKDNDSVWSYRIENFLQGKGVWELITGEDVCPIIPEENPSDEDKILYKTWIEKSQKILHWISICISKTLIPIRPFFSVALPIRKHSENNFC